MKQKIFRVIVPAVLAGIALALALYRVYLYGRDGTAIVSLMVVPVSAALLLAHSVWERPRAGSYWLLGMALVLPVLGALSGLPLVSRGGRDFWRSVQPYLSTPFAFHQYKSIGITFDICLIVAYAGLLVLIVEAFIGKDFLSRVVSFVTFAGFTAYVAVYVVNYGPRLVPGDAVCGYGPHILIFAAVALMSLWKAEKAGDSGRADGPDYEAYREMLLELMRMRRDGALSGAAYAERRDRLLDRL